MKRRDALLLSRAVRGERRRRERRPSCRGEAAPAASGALSWRAEYCFTSAADVIRNFLALAFVVIQIPLTKEMRCMKIKAQWVLMIGLVALLCLAGWGGSRAQSAVRSNWEYKIVIKYGVPADVS